MELIKVAVSEIIPYAKNPRKNDAAVKEVKQSIKECGYQNPIIVDENMVVLCGHTRLKAIKELGWQEVEVVVQSGLTEDQKKKYRIYDNKTSEFAQWDADMLAAEMEDLDFSAFDLDWSVEEDTESYSSDLSEYDDDEDYDSDKEYGNEEFTDDDFSDDTFKYRCPACGFMFG